MKVLLTTLSLLTLTSCAMVTSSVKGYKGEERTKILQSIKGMNPEQAKEILGQPAAMGKCDKRENKSCKSSIVQLLYLEDTTLFPLYISNIEKKQRFDCFVIDFRFDEKKNDFIYTYGSMPQTDCGNSEYGAIKRLSKTGL